MNTLPTPTKRTKRKAEPIEMQKRRHGYFPKTFVWRERQYQVLRIERCWTISRHSQVPRVERQYFRIRCTSAQDTDESTFDVYQDIQHNTWHLQQQANQQGDQP